MKSLQDEKHEFDTAWNDITPAVRATIHALTHEDALGELWEGAWVAVEDDIGDLAIGVSHTAKLWGRDRPFA